AGMRDDLVTGVQTCALPISRKPVPTVRATAPAPAQPITPNVSPQMAQRYGLNRAAPAPARAPAPPPVAVSPAAPAAAPPSPVAKIGRAACRARGAVQDVGAR